MRMMADRSVVSVPIYVESNYIAIGRSLKHNGCNRAGQQESIHNERLADSLQHFDLSALPLHIIISSRGNTATCDLAASATLPMLGATTHYR
jgi:hypothetical protein